MWSKGFKAFYAFDIVRLLVFTGAVARHLRIIKEKVLAVRDWTLNSLLHGSYSNALEFYRRRWADAWILFILAGDQRYKFGKAGYWLWNIITPSRWSEGEVKWVEAFVSLFALTVVKPSITIWELVMNRKRAGMHVGCSCSTRSGLLLPLHSSWLVVLLMQLFTSYQYRFFAMLSFFDVQHHSIL